MLSDFVVYFEP